MNRSNYTLLLIFFCFFFKTSFGQSVNLNRDTSIAVIKSGVQLENAWAGGMNTPVFAPIDLNGDGKMDLIEFDAPSFRLNPFINKGIPNVTSYVYAPEYAKKFPGDLEGWVKTFDYDFDGDLDLFTYNGGGIELYRNDFNLSNGLNFTLITHQMQTHYGSFSTNIYASRVNAPAFSDVDNDGDMDILAFSISGSWVEHNKNYSMDSTGTPGQFMFYNIPVCWGYFVLSNTSNVGVLPPVLPTCPLIPADPFLRSPYADIDKLGKGPYSMAAENKLRHAGSSVFVLDMDGDGDKDLLNGDILGPTLLYMENCGTPDSAWMCSQDTSFPSYNVPANMRDVSGPHYFDGNNDGNNDLIVSNFYFTGEDYHNVRYYRNTTNNQTNVFSFVTDRWLVDEMIEVGTGAHPVFFDVDQDGKKDMLIGNDFYFNNGAEVGKIAYYRNTGTGLKAEYTFVTDDFSGLSGTGLLGLYPTFGDLDGDGDQDMLLGESDGNLEYFQNIAGAGNPCIFILTQPNYQSINIGDNASPQLVDVDRDGAIDLLIGERTGVLNYYRNTGSSSVPIFTYVSNTFGGVNVMKVGSYAGFSAPLLFDNGAGYELLVGSMSGYIYHYNNIDGNLTGNFNLVDSMYKGIYEPAIAVPAMDDVDGDGKFDLAVGSLPGGVVLYTQNPLLSSENEILSDAYFTMYPNPTSGIINLTLNGNSGSRSIIEVFDVRGSRMIKSESLINQVKLDVSGLMSGLYLCVVRKGDKVFSQKFVKQ